MWGLRDPRSVGSAPVGVVCQGICSARTSQQDIGFCTIWYGDLVGYETVNTGMFDAPVL